MSILTERSIDALEEIISKMDSEITNQLPKREEYLQVDKYLQKTGDYSSDTKKGQAANRSGDKSKIGNVEIPITYIYKETAEAFLTGIFLTGNPLFAAVSSKEHEDVAAMMNGLVGRDQYRLNWAGELSRNIDDVLRYNITACEVVWGTRRATAAGTKIDAEPTRSHSGEALPIIYRGNVLKRIDPYNLIYDRKVEPSKVHIDGSYVGYFELIDYIQLKRRFHEWNDVFTVKKNIEAAFKGIGSKHRYYVPNFRSDTNSAAHGEDWSHFWGTGVNVPDSSGQGQYELTTLYKRIIPREHKLDVPLAGVAQVYKLIWVGTKLIYAEPVISGHEYLPIIIGQMYPGNSDVKSFCEYITDLQDLGTSLMTASLDSLRRAIGDRALYDPTRIRKGDIEAASPVSKIPVNNNTYERNNLQSAYYQIPYVDNVSPSFQQHLGLVFNLAEQTTGQNKASQGSFIKGNKTMFEFDKIMSNSEGRLQLGALRLEQSFFTPIKEIVKMNYLVYAEAETVDSTADHEEIEIDPVMLREVAPDFKMADGIMPSTKLANTEVLMQATQAFAQNPTLFMDYDIGAMWVSIIKQQGFHDIEAYRRTEEQKQQFLQMIQPQETVNGPGPEEPSGA